MDRDAAQVMHVKNMLYDSEKLVCETLDLTLILLATAEIR